MNKYEKISLHFLENNLAVFKLELLKLSKKEIKEMIEYCRDVIGNKALNNYFSKHVA